jgi:hypothetical protein
MLTKNERFSALRKRFPTLVKISSEEFEGLSTEQIDEIEKSANAAVKAGELTDATRPEWNGKGSLLEQSCKAKGWTNYSSNSDETRDALKVR